MERLHFPPLRASCKLEGVAKLRSICKASADLRGWHRMQRACPRVETIEDRREHQPQTLPPWTKMDGEGGGPEHHSEAAHAETALKMDLSRSPGSSRPRVDVLSLGQGLGEAPHDLLLGLRGDIGVRILADLAMPVPGMLGVFPVLSSLGALSSCSKATARIVREEDALWRRILLALRSRRQVENHCRELNTGRRADASYCGQSIQVAGEKDDGVTPSADMGRPPVQAEVRRAMTMPAEVRRAMTMPRNCLLRRRWQIWTRDGLEIDGSQATSEGANPSRGKVEKSNEALSVAALLRGHEEGDGKALSSRTACAPDGAADQPGARAPGRLYGPELGHEGAGAADGANFENAGLTRRRLLAHGGSERAVHEPMRGRQPAQWRRTAGGLRPSDGKALLSRTARAPDGAADQPVTSWFSETKELDAASIRCSV